MLLDEDRGGPVLIAAVSDGAGSATHSEIGSRLACASFAAAVTTLMRETGSGTPVARAQIETWLEHFGRQVSDEAGALQLTPRDLACTFVGAVVAPTWSAFCQIGDGGIVIGVPDEEQGAPVTKFDVVFWPEQGEYANETYFATTAAAAQHLQFRVDERSVREVTLFSDGLQRLVLKFDAREPFVPFFHRMLQTVRRVTESAGEARELSRGLAAYLGSAIVSERTDDDVTLVLATQCPELPEPALRVIPGSEASASAPVTGAPGEAEGPPAVGAGAVKAP
jgi:hypothetical protein